MTDFRFVLTEVHTTQKLRGVLKVGEVQADQVSAEVESANLILAVAGSPRTVGVFAIVKDIGPVVSTHSLASVLAHITWHYYPLSEVLNQRAREQLANHGHGLRQVPLMVPVQTGMLTGTTRGVAFNTKFLEQVRVVDKHTVEFKVMISRQRHCTAQLTVPKVDVSNYAAKFEFVQPYAALQYAVNVLKYGRAVGRTEAELAVARTVLSQTSLDPGAFEQMGNLRQTATQMADEAEAQTWALLAERKQRPVSDERLLKIVRKTIFNSVMHPR